MNFKLYLSALCIMSMPLLTGAQTWQWGKQGGDVTDGVNTVPFETVWDMATDPNGNVYTISVIEGSNAPKVDGHTITPYDKKDLLLSSFTCDGQYRWSKHIGGWNDEHPSIYWQKSSLKIDDAGHVYVAGRVGAQLTAPNPTRFDTDTVLPSTSKKFAFLVQYDTSGNFQWLRMPESDTATRVSVVMHDIDLDSAGNAYVLCSALPGKLADGNFVVTSEGWHILRYTPQGTLTAVTNLPAQFTQGSGVTVRMARNKVNGNYALAGFKALSGNTLIINNQSVFYGYVVSYSSTGAFRWLSTGSTTIDNRPQVDMYDNVYIAGTAEANKTIFNGYVTANHFNSNYFVPYIIKFNNSGQIAWAKNGESPYSAYGSAIGLHNNRLYLAGHYSDTFSFAGWPKVLNHTLAQNFDIYLASLSLKDGSILSLDTLGSTFGALEAAAEITFDKRNNIYVGGYMHDNLTVGSSTLNKYGGYSDFLLAKFGYNNCNCTTPVSNFGFFVDATNTGGFTFSGTMSHDSVSWDFGDGSYGSGGAVNHKYASQGFYLVCATVYTQCGAATKCMSVAATGIEDALFGKVAVYPNPVKDELVVDGAANGIILSLQDVYGKQLHQQTVISAKTIIPVAQLPAGIYLLNMTAPDGRRHVQKLVKE